MKLIKFKRGTTPLNRITGKALSLGLHINVAPDDFDCCFIEEGGLSCGQIGSQTWEDDRYEEISEDYFLNNLSKK